VDGHVTAGSISYIYAAIYSVCDLEVSDNRVVEACCPRLRVPACIDVTLIDYQSQTVHYFLVLGIFGIAEIKDCLTPVVVCHRHVLENLFCFEIVNVVDKTLIKFRVMGVQSGVGGYSRVGNV
jgi:hypothetical protein